MTKRLDGINIANKIAKNRGGRCLSTKYINNHTGLIWECSQRHQWDVSLHNVKDNENWCSYCVGLRLKDGLKLAQQIANNKNGKCLSINYVNNKIKMSWQCKEEHIWKSSLNSVMSNDQWCPKCAPKLISEKKRLQNGLEIAQQISKEKGGKCLSVEYINTSTKMLWKCGDGHVWEVALHNIKYGDTWCPKCSSKRRRKTMKQIYGVEHPMHNKEIALKVAKSSNNCYISYNYKTGEELICQGSWEKKAVEYFNFNKINFRWQPKSFKMPDGRTYRPDLYLFSTKKWIEIKGYFRKDAKEKWDWFQTIKPNSELWDENKLKDMGILQGACK